MLTSWMAIDISQQIDPKYYLEKLQDKEYKFHL